MLRLRQIALVAEKLGPVVDGLREAFALEVAYRDPSVATWGLENALLPVGAQFLEVVAPTREGTAAGRYLQRRRGDGGYMVILQTDDQAAHRRAATELGVRTAFEHELPDYSVWQLHPRDTGGAFLEIDVQQGGEDMRGAWHPAGGKAWHAAVRTDVIRAIAAAEIQSEDPVTLAARWGRILGRPVEERQDGACIVRLDVGALRFVADRDGRGEGLGGVDLVVGDREPARVATDAVAVGGVRFTLQRDLPLTRPLAGLSPKGEADPSPLPVGERIRTYGVRSDADQRKAGSQAAGGRPDTRSGG